MSESYTRGGDTTQSIIGDTCAAQTFTPLETHTPYYIDLQLQTALLHPTPNAKIYLADPDHKPFGPAYSETVGYFGYRRARKIGYRFRCKITPYEFIAGHEYVIVVKATPGEPGDAYLWVYDKDDAKYERGRRLVSADNGSTWTVKENDDHIFCEFGNPPLPKPDPPPPIDNFSTLDISYDPATTAVLITISTNVPCFLTCYYTDKKPLKHHTERTVRGITVPWGTYFCFAAWKSVDQIEPDDTMYHTFQIPDWHYCQTRWLTFRGTIEDIDSPSISPIFEKHHPGVLTYTNLGVSKKAYYRYVMSANPGDPDVLYNLAHDKEQALSYWEGVIQYGQRIRVIGTYAYAELRRTAILFNTGILPPCTLLGATLRLDIAKVDPPAGYTANWAWALEARAGQDLNSQITHGNLTNYSKILALGTTIGGKYTDDLPDWPYRYWWYIDVPLEFINLNGFTVITLLNNKDRLGNRPENNTIEETLFIANSFSILQIAYWKH